MANKCIKHFRRANDIHFGVTARLGERLPRPSLRGEMDHGRRMNVGQQVIPVGSGGHIPEDEFDTFIESCWSLSNRMHLRVQIVQRDDPVEVVSERA